MTRSRLRSARRLGFLGDRDEEHAVRGKNHQHQIGLRCGRSLALSPRSPDPCVLRDRRFRGKRVCVWRLLGARWRDCCARTGSRRSRGLRRTAPRAGQPLSLFGPAFERPSCAGTRGWFRTRCWARSGRPTGQLVGGQRTSRARDANGTRQAGRALQASNQGRKSDGKRERMLCRGRWKRGTPSSQTQARSR